MWLHLDLAETLYRCPMSYSGLDAFGSVPGNDLCSAVEWMKVGLGCEAEPLGNEPLNWLLHMHLAASGGDGFSVLESTRRHACSGRKRSRTKPSSLWTTDQGRGAG